MSIVSEVEASSLNKPKQETGPKALKPGELHPFDSSFQFSCDACTLINNYDLNNIDTACCNSCGERKYDVSEKIREH